MSVSPTTPSPSGAHARPLRSDGAEARIRLLDAALQLFADKGFAKTSIREIALAAQVNVASISYYFGDKDGLYRAVFEDPRYNPAYVPADENLPPPDIRSVLTLMLRTFVEPLQSGEQVRQCMKLHFREMIEPTGMWQAEIDNNITPSHGALVQALCHHMGVAAPDDDMHRLAFQLVGLGVMLHVGIDVIQAIRPALIADSAALDLYHERLLMSAMALVDAEQQRRIACVRHA